MTDTDKYMQQALDDQQEPLLLKFRLGNNEFSLSILRIRAVLAYAEMTTPSDIPAFAHRGEVDVDGTSVPVLDIGVRYGYAPSQATDQTLIVVVEVDSGDCAHPLGLIVDAIIGTSEERISEQAVGLQKTMALFTVGGQSGGKE